MLGISYVVTGPRTLKVLGRDITLQKTCGSIADCTFDELCGRVSICNIYVYIYYFCHKKISGMTTFSLAVLL